jgi:RNA polymerase sigma factor (sigma-70 family)
VSKKKKKRQKKPPPSEGGSNAVLRELTKIYEENRGPVFNEAYSIVRDVERARDLAHEAFKLFLIYRPVVLRPGHWLRKVVRNRALNDLRNQKKHDEKLHEIHRALIRPAAETESALAATIDTSRLRALAYGSESSLGLVEQQVLQMILADTSVVDMARAIGIPESTMHDLKRRVLNSVRALLQIDHQSRKAL